MARFQQGDSVSYVGEKFAEKLAGSEGIICAHIRNSEHGVVVDFPSSRGVDSYIMDEEKHLIPFNKSLKPREKRDERRKDTKVEHRRSRKTSADDSEA